MASKRAATGEVPKRFNKHDKEYGTPVPGSKTEARGKLAHQRVSKEIWELCCIIEENGITRKGKEINKNKQHADTSEKLQETKCIQNDDEEHFSITTIDFRTLFAIYTFISNKLVGVLLRARKYGLVDFEGETLFQRRDDNVIITLLYPSSKVKKMLDEKPFTWGKCL